MSNTAWRSAELRAGRLLMILPGLHRPRRRFSQNFLVDPGVVRNIVDAIDPQSQDRLVEIGPGRGSLTTLLVEKVAVLHAVEIDRDLFHALNETFPPHHLRLHLADALEFDFSSLGPDLRVVGNLPYHISTPLLFRMNAMHDALRDCHFMLQEEVVDRMAAAPGSAQYGRLSVMLQYRWHVTPLFVVPPGAFRPQPKVRSALVRLVPYRVLPSRARNEQAFSRVVSAAFSKRRKTLRNALRGLLGESVIRGCGIDPQTRGETLSVAEFVRLAEAVDAQATFSG